jgi:hypothetical protein
MLLPLRPKLTLFESANDTVCRLALVVPAMKLTAPPPPAALAVMTPLLKPKLTPLELANDIVPEFCD